MQHLQIKSAIFGEGYLMQGYIACMPNFSYFQTENILTV